jgi:hypothetical protein
MPEFYLIHYPLTKSQVTPILATFA